MFEVGNCTLKIERSFGLLPFHQTRKNHHIYEGSTSQLRDHDTVYDAEISAWKTERK
jgi:hypothetical protein